MLHNSDCQLLLIFGEYRQFQVPVWSLGKLAGVVIEGLPLQHRFKLVAQQEDVYGPHPQM